jgi:hypothetical protein
MSRYVICARSPKTGARLYLTVKGTLATRGRSRKFDSLDSAWKVGRNLLRQHPQLRDYTLHAEALPPVPTARTNPKRKPKKRRNPSGYSKARDAYLADIDAAAEKFETFTGFRATKETRFSHKRVNAGFALGKLVSVTYEQNRLGDGLSHYKHDFKKNSRPLLVSSVDGDQLAIVGGRYRVSENVGIEDAD